MEFENRMREQRLELSSRSSNSCFSHSELAAQAAGIAAMDFKLLAGGRSRHAGIRARLGRVLSGSNRTGAACGHSHWIGRR